MFVHLLGVATSGLLSQFLISCAVQSTASSERTAPQDLDYQLSVPESEYWALYDLYNATDGSNWRWKLNTTKGAVWNFNGQSDPCLDNWQGINCARNQTQGHIKAISLVRYNLIGTIPESIAIFTKLKVLVLRGNYLSGTIPESVSTMFRLEKLQLNFNDLSGTLPSSLSNCSQLQVLQVSSNNLVGPLPPSFGDLRKLQVFDLFNNHMHGLIPETFSQLTALVFFDLYKNDFSGTIPEFLGSYEECQYLFLGKNAFTGTFPSVIGQLSKLLALYVNSNRLTGTVPTSLASLHLLVNLAIQDNHFSGNMQGVVNPGAQHNLSIVLFSGNELTGQIPTELFQLDRLTVLDGGSNCMSGSLPETICTAESLCTLVLDGLHTSHHCQSLLLPDITRTYALTNPITGGIPTCLFELPQLTTLHLSGNGLTGALPGHVQLRPTFVDFTMSHNFMDGTIPQQFQQHAWANIDLSYNRLQGILGKDFAAPSPNSSIKFSNNRLTGALPPAVIQALHVDVLQGNLFACSAAETGLPQHDPSANTYQCGSNTFNLSYYFWLGATAVMFSYALVYILEQRGAGVTVYRALFGALAQARALLSVFELTDADGYSYKPQLRRYRKICDICKLLVRMACLLTAYILIVLLPFYVAIGVYYETHEHTYAYKASILFLSGRIPMGLALMLLSLFALFAFACFVVLLRDYQRECVQYEHQISSSASVDRTESDNSQRDSASHAEHTITREKLYIYAGCILVDVLVVVGANIGFILVVLNGNETFLTMAQVALSLFRIFWSSVCSWTAYHLAVIVDFESRNIRKGILSMLFLITLFNNIVAPCLVVMVISATCFYNVFEPSANVNTSFSYVECVNYDDNGCTDTAQALGNSTFDPPFIYSYQCAASFVTAYAPSFVYLCIVSGILTPALRWMDQWTLRRCTKGSRWYKLLYSVTPQILRPISTSKCIERKLFSPYFDSRNLLVTLLNYLGILMTFGAVFPPLAVAMCLTIISHIYFSRLELKKFLEEAARKNTDYIDVIDEDCLGVGSDSMLLRSIWVLITLSFWFYTLFLFDTLGDAVGLGGAFWVLILVPGMPVLLYVMFKLYTGTFFVRTRVRVLSTRMNNVEMMAQLHAEAAKMDLEVTSPMPHNGRNSDN